MGLALDVRALTRDVRALSLDVLPLSPDVRVLAMFGAPAFRLARRPLPAQRSSDS